MFQSCTPCCGGVLNTCTVVVMCKNFDFDWGLEEEQAPSGSPAAPTFKGPAWSMPSLGNRHNTSSNSPQALAVMDQIRSNLHIGMLGGVQANLNLPWANSLCPVFLQFRTFTFCIRWQLHRESQVPISIFEKTFYLPRFSWFE